MVVLTFFLNNMFSWTYILIVHCCHGNSTQLKGKNKGHCLGKRIKCPPIKTPLQRPFCCCLVCSTAVKVAVVAPWIHQSRVKPASLKWECIPDPGSPCKITSNVSALPGQDFTSQETTRDHRRLTTALL
jgi:hypothetical protein